MFRQARGTRAPDAHSACEVGCAEAAPASSNALGVAKRRGNSLTSQTAGPCNKIPMFTRDVWQRFIRDRTSLWRCTQQRQVWGREGLVPPHEFF